MSLPTLLNSQTPKTLSPFPISNPHSPCLYPFRTLTFSRKLPPLLHNSLSPLNSPPKLPLSSHQREDQQLEEEHEDEDHVIGDCVVFEDGVFDDPYLQEHFKSTPPEPRPKKSAAEIEPQNLVPDKWRESLVALNITKKERRKIAHEMEFGSRVNRKKGLMPVWNVSVEEYLKHRETKLAQLKPLVLDNPNFPANEEKREAEVKEEWREGRLAPKNPRWAVYGRGLDDVSEFFNSGSYEPGQGAVPQGRRKLFTKEEKILLNKRRPDLAAATSDKWLPLHTLAASGEFYLMDALLKHDVDINGADKDGLTALHRAIISKKQAITNYLLRESANPFVCDADGASLMHFAVRAASVHAIKILLLYNVDINRQDNDGWTPLHLAVQTRRTDVVRLLLIKGADKTLKNKDGLTPLELCLYSGRDTRTYELIKLMKLVPKPR
ncbi:ankyrin repeat domain-containing protein, chloroplastic [Malania oleifera]|uniref:ankyrin repeat domain-containing protein, chloroplastic n=1 Tax=Malania oleifera TaxID=397392 RepID=UPI0025AE7DBC|nr:ankyrin repeat domain-containing protein, chloroplastic [Malania oleifera]